MPNDTPAPAAMTDADKWEPSKESYDCWEMRKKMAELIADREAELARLRRELFELCNEFRKEWDRKESFEYQDGYEDARDLMGQQVEKILNGATAKEVQEWLMR